MYTEYNLQTMHTKIGYDFQKPLVKDVDLKFII